MENQIKGLELKRDGLNVDIDRETFALQLKTWRLRKGLTQQQLGERWGMSRFKIIKAETAKIVSWEVAYKMFVRLSEELRKEAGYETIK